jgi:hypothetical protein
MRAARYFPFLLVTLVGCAAYSQKNNEVTRIEFTSLTRGYSEQTIFTKDSLITTILERGVEASSRKEKVKSQDWEDLLKSIQDLTLSEVSDLKSPTVKRTYDGAKHSTLSFTTPAGVVSHSFDDRDPHEKLLPLMKIVIRLTNQ